MTSPTPSSTTLRVRIAEAQGWTHNEYMPDLWWHQDSPHCQDGKYCDEEHVPDYPNDLNACAQFTKGMLFNQRQKYYRELQKVCGEGMGGICLVAFQECIDATARQRCLAYLATVNPEGKK